MITYRLSFYSHTERSGRVSLMARLTMDGIKPVNVALGRSVGVGMWDKSRQRVNPKDKGARDTNLLLSDIERDVAQFFTRIELVEQRTPTREEIVHTLKSAAGRTNSSQADNRTLKAAIVRYTEAMAGQWTLATHKKYVSLMHHIEDYHAGAWLTDVDERWLAGFVRHLLTEVRNTTATKYVKALKAFMRWSEEVNGTQHLRYRSRLKGGDADKEIVYLTIDELKKVEVCELDGTMAQVRDVFVFCCYTGLRFSDAKRLRHEDDHDTYIDIVTQKTGDRLRIELNTHARRILDRYARLPSMALPAISNQKSNWYLKAIGRMCGITSPVRRVWYVGAERNEDVVEKCEVMTTHTARRTFVVTALQLGIPAEVIMRWTGHNDYNSMKPYIAIVDELKKKSMERFNDL